MTDESLLSTLSRALAGVRHDDLPHEVRWRARQRILDTLGCLAAGYSAPVAPALKSYGDAQPTAAETTLLPSGRKVSVSLAAMIHGSLIHGLELSDAAPRGTVHPGNEIVPAALAIAERDGRSGADVIAAVVAGYEAEIRVGRTLFPHAFYCGWWTPGLLGVVGPAVTTAHLMGLGAGGIADAIGIAVNLAPAAVEHINTEGVTVKWLIGGQATATGILAAEMAARGITGMRDIGHGWLPVLSSENHPERLTEGLGPDGAFVEWELLNGVVTKYYAAVGPFAGPLDAIFGVLEGNDIEVNEITSIEVECMKRAAMFDNPRPANDIVARSSLSYCLAAAVFFRDPGALLARAFTATSLADPEIAALEAKVRIIENEEYERHYPAKSLARVTIATVGGKSASLEVDRAVRPRYLTPSDDDIAGKFRSLAGPVLGDRSCEQVIKLVFDLGLLKRVDPVLTAMTPVSSS